MDEQTDRQKLALFFLSLPHQTFSRFGGVRVLDPELQSKIH